MSNRKLTITAPAKLNLDLAVLDRRSDGFHNLDSIFIALDFGDILHIQPAGELKSVNISIEWTGRDIFPVNIPVENNLIYRALSLFREKTGFFEGLEVKVEKNIPVGGGLGGGSSDAAAALLVINELAGFPLNRGKLMKLAFNLGSDIPFFIHKTAAARITGRGEYITPVEVPFRHFTLVNPGFPSDTAAAFRLLDEYREKNKNITHKSYSNDFLDCFNDPEKTIYNNIISGLLRLGADFAGLSGSGSTCFGAFREKIPAQEAAKALSGEWKFTRYSGILSAGN